VHLPSAALGQYGNYTHLAVIAIRLNLFVLRMYLSAEHNTNWVQIGLQKIRFCAFWDFQLEMD